MKNIPELFGCQVFNDEMMRQRLPEDIYKALKKTMEQGKHLDSSIADVVAAAMNMELHLTREEVFDAMHHI